MNRPFLTKFQAHGLESDKYNERDWDMLTLDNLSASGVAFRHCSGIEPGQQILMHIIFPAVSETPIPTIARIVRNERITHSSVYFIFHVGAQFIGIDSNKRQMIKENIDEFFKTLDFNTDIPLEIKAEVWMRDKAHCTKCATKKDLGFYYNFPLTEGGAIAVENVLLLCKPCQAHNN